jgi:DNA-binding MurR/RpiR family transcriptional regulator
MGTDHARRERSVLVGRPDDRHAPGSRSLADLLARHLDRLSPKHKVIAQFVTDNPQFASLASTRQLAERTGADAATITRFAKALGFSGFNRLRQELRHTYLGHLDPQELMRRQRFARGNVYRAAILRDLQNLQNLLDTLDTSVLDRVAARLLAARRTVVIATGSYAAPALVLGHICTALDVHVDVETRGRLYWSSQIASLTSRDLVIGISFWQCDRDTVDALQWANEHGVPTAAITDSSVSPLAKHANLRVIVPTEGLLFFQSVTTSLSVVYGLVATIWARLSPSRRSTYARIRQAFRDLDVFVK